MSEAEHTVQAPGIGPKHGTVEAGVLARAPKEQPS